MMMLRVLIQDQWFIFWNNYFLRWGEMVFLPILTFKLPQAMERLYVFSLIILVFSSQSCEIPIDADQAQDSIRGEITISDNLTDKVKLGDTITVSYRQSEVFTINDKEKCTVYEEDIEKFYLSLVIYVQDDNKLWARREVLAGSDLFNVVPVRGEYFYSRLYPKFDIKTREYVGEFKIIFKKMGLFIIEARENGRLKFKNVNAFTLIKFNKPYNIHLIPEFLANRPQAEKDLILSSSQASDKQDVRDMVFFES
jgi:hypothetical protein